MPSSDRFEPRQPRQQRASDAGTGVPNAGVAGTQAQAAREPAQYFDPTEPWDAQSAEALTRLYESADGALHRQHDGDRTRRQHPSLGAIPAAAPTSDTHVHDRAWLEARLADIAQRLQASLAELNPDKALAPFNRRLDLIEERFGEALSRVAQRSDLDGLRLIEAHVLELAAHVEQTRGRLDRIDAIDDQVRGLARRFEEGHDQRLDALERLLQDYVAEWRRGDERTAGALQTLEGAVTRISDSVEAMEASKPAPDLSLSLLGVSDLGSPHVESDPLSQVYADGARVLEPRGYRSTLDAADYAPRPEPAPEQAAAPAVAAAASEWYAPPADGLPARPADEELGPPALPAAASQWAAPPADAEHARPATVELAPPAFRALAMRAKLRQAQALAVEAASASEQPARPPVAAVLRDPARLSVTRPTRPSILLAAGVTLFAAGGYLMVDVFMTAAASRGPRQLEQGARPVGGRSLLVGPQAEPVGPQAEPVGSKAEPVQSPPAAETNTPHAGPPAGDRPQGAPRPPAPPFWRHKAPEVDDLTDNAASPSRKAATIGSAIATVFRAKTESVLPGTVVLQSDGPPGGDLNAPLTALPMTIGPASLRQAAMSGDPAAQYEIATRYAAGHGVGRDLQQALQWYGRAAMRGLAPAQYRLGALHERGLGTAPDPERARAWYARAAAQGHVKAMHNLAVLSVGGGRSDYATAAKWFAAAADHGLTDSQFNLAVLYQGGLGVPKDLQFAYQWFTLAARGGDREAAGRIAQVKAQLGPAGLQAANEMVATWRVRTPDPVVNETATAAQATGQ